MSMPSSSASVVITARSSPRISRRLELAALLRRCSRRGRARRARPARGSSARSSSLDQPAEQLDALARLHEADRARALAHQAREQLGRLAERRAARAERLVGQRRVPDRDPPPRRRRAVVVDQRDVLEAGQPLGQLDRVGDRRRGQQEARLGAVGGGDPPQAAQHVGDVRAEHAAVDVRLVDDDDREVREQVAPRRAWLGRIPTCSMSGLVSTTFALLADLARAPRAACRRRRSPGARAWAGRTRPARAPGPGRAPWSDRGTARARARRGRGRRASAG